MYMYKVLFKPSPYILSDSVILMGPRSRSIDSLPIHTQPLPHLFQPLFHNRHYSAVTCRPHIHQHVSSTANSGDECLQQFLNRQVITQRGISAVSPWIMIYCHGIFPFMSLKLTWKYSKRKNAIRKCIHIHLNSLSKKNDLIVSTSCFGSMQWKHKLRLAWYWKLQEDGLKAV